MVAKYKQILQTLSSRIDGMNPGDALPSEEELSKEFGVSPMTTRRALTILLDAKRIVGIRGKGTFVSQHPVTRTMTLMSFSEAMRSQGRVPNATVLGMSMSPADANTAEILGVPTGTNVYSIRRLRFGDDVPIGVDESLLPADRFPGLLGQDLGGSLYAVLREQYDTAIERATSRITAVTPSPETASLLELGVNTPCLAVHATAKDEHGAIVESTRSQYRGDLYELTVDHHRDELA
ncbi:Predicted transcriptional regulator of N-Acetylglucosamine utilization, GntR family [Microbacterium esteraromaticum]|uniref:Predicted transcriptional regulator of N-Acetylglucosamine utilization, GntR family n=1 Tax=Microbacterium esteraromaticum TaxID=57043 RepID=A0A1R4IMD9_9MICO|nr:GntR family transcriptional regulator [Microbacterium esteraromaticum]SJN20845.1 Predicted transcriptional regulator of N-Acetylglucosamine utilization, GntR family [Microbacterium esteraromaticum]